MALQYILRLLWVCLMLFVVGCFPELSKGDMTGNDPKIKMQALDNFKNVDPRIQNPIKSSLQRNVEQFNSRYQWPRFNSDPYSPKSVADFKKASADVMHYQNKILSSVSSRNNPVELSSVKHDNRFDGKRSYAFQHNPAHFTGSQKSSSEINLAPRLVKKYGLVNGMNAGNVYRSGSFGYQHISKSDQSQPYLRENTDVQVIRPANYMSRSSTANHNMRLKSDGNAMFDQSQLLRRVVPASTSLSIVKPNQHGLKPSPNFSTDTAVPFPSKMLMPSRVSSNSNQGRLILPLKKSLLFSSEHDLIQKSDSRRVASNPRSSFEYRNIKLSTSSYTLKDIHSTSVQRDYHNMGRSGQNVAPIQRYDHMAKGFSANKPSMIDNVLSNKRFLSDKNSSQVFSLVNQSMQGTHMTPSKQFPENTVLIWERDKSINPPDTTNHLLRKASQHNPRFGTDLNSSGQSTEQSLFVKNYPVPILMPGNTMKSVYSGSLSVYASRDQSRPYYLTSKKPYIFKGFNFVPTVQRFLQKPLTNLNMHTTQNPLIPDRKEKKLFQLEDIKTSQEKHPEQDLTDSDNNKPQLSFKDGDSIDTPKHHDVKVQAVATSGNNTSSNGKVPLRNYLETGFDEVQSKTSQTDSNPSEMPTAKSLNEGSDTHPSIIKSTENPKSEYVLPIRKSSLINKGAGNAVIHPFRRFYNKGQEGPPNLAKDMKKRISDGVAQSGTSKNGVRSSLQSAVVVGKKVEVAEEGNSSSLNIFPFPGSPIYRSADVKSHKTSRLFEISEEGNSSSQNVFSFPGIPIYRSSDAKSPKNVLFEVAEEGNSSSQNVFSFQNTPIYRPTNVKSPKTNISFEVAKEGNSSSQNVFSFPNTPIYRSSDVKSPKTNILFEVPEEVNSSSQNVFSFQNTPIYRSTNVKSPKTNISFEVAEEGNSSSQNVFSFPNTPIYRSSDVKSHKTNSLSTIHRSVKPLDWGNETKIDFSAVGVSQSLSPTSSIVVARLVKTIDKALNKTSLNASSTSSLSNFKPFQFSDIAGSASFAKTETRSAHSEDVVDVRSFTNRSNSTLIEKMTNSSSVTLKGDVQPPVNISESEFLQTAATDTDMEFQLFHREEYTQPETPVYSTKLQPDHNDLFNKGTLTLQTTDLVKVTS